MELVGRLEAHDGAHERGCEGRNMACTCGDDVRGQSLLTEAAACIREMVEKGERSVDYEVYQDDVLVAGSDSEREIRHYAAVYEQDGPVEVFKVVSFRRPLPPAPGAEA